MSEKKQRTAAGMREKMLNRYGTEHHHKHDKNHKTYRLHHRSHPAQTHENFLHNKEVKDATGLIKKFKLRKIRKRLDKGRFH